MKCFIDKNTNIGVLGFISFTPLLTIHESIICKRLVQKEKEREREQQREEVYSCALYLFVYKSHVNGCVDRVGWLT